MASPSCKLRIVFAPIMAQFLSPTINLLWPVWVTRLNNLYFWEGGQIIVRTENYIKSDMTFMPRHSPSLLVFQVVCVFLPHSSIARQVFQNVWHCPPCIPQRNVKEHDKGLKESHSKSPGSWLLLLVLVSGWPELYPRGLSLKAWEDDRCKRMKSMTAF
jgi:hypothetical protein